MVFGDVNLETRSVGRKTIVVGQGVGLDPIHHHGSQ